ncbi:MAG TPA: 6-hydroxymethylpterin diphosphokinase MptE-like protein [Patescibacteria group bacterium]|nr:6-hydroxymethylpterin diphosphokinase MptE-like protein [Patescibacteria group bacterium]
MNIKWKKHKKEKTPKNHSTALPHSAPDAGGYLQNQSFHKNMMVLQRRYPEIVRMLETMPPTQDYDFVPTPKRMMNLYIKSKNFFYYDQEDPIADVKKQIAELKLKNTRLAVFLGIGLGYEVVYYLSEISSQQDTSMAILVERDPYVFLAALRTTDLTEVLNSEQLHLIVGAAEEEMYLNFQKYFSDGPQRFLFVRSMAPVYHLSSLRLNKEYYLSVIRHLREAAHQKILEYGNCPEDSLIGVDHMLKNLQEIVANPGINLLYDSFKGKPAIVVSSGPSLNKNKHLLKGLEEKAVIIAANSTLRPLLAMGVKPHMVTALERVKESIRLMDGYDPADVADVYYTACPVVHEKNYEVYSGPRIIVYRAFDHFKWLGIEKGMINVKASSGNMAFKMASVLGCDPIIIIGQDLAFGEGDLTHVEGTDFGDHQTQYYNKPRIQVPGNLGQPVWTDPGFWYTCLKGYEVDVAENSGRVINSTEGGAYINGTEVMPFQEAIDQYLQQDIQPLQIIREKLAAFTASDSAQEARQVYRNILTSLKDMDVILGYCDEGIRLYEENKDHLNRFLTDPEYQAQHSAGLTELQNKMIAPRRNCIQLHFTWQLLLAHVIQSYNIKFEMQIIDTPRRYDDRQLAAADTMLQHAEWYAVISDLVKIVKGKILQAKAGIEEQYDVSSVVTEH